MTKISILTAALLLAAGVAQAQTAPATSGLYGDVGYTFLNLKSDGPTVKPGALRGIVGWDLHPNVAIEAMLATGLKDDTVDGVKFKVSRSYGIFVTPKYNFDQFEVFGRVGYADSKIKASSQGLSGSDSDGSFAWGLGGRYNFSKTLYGGLDYMQYYKKDGLKIDGVTLNVGYRF
ncbi:porin family protein [Roseateles chitinivorans]|uniref:porin family protein n=1 Tax=Roseateles chitinivorans TaxID=2917965 RepID=UPI003D66BC28